MLIDLKNIFKLQIKESIGIVLDDGGFYEELTLAEMKNAIAPAYSTCGYF